MTTSFDELVSDARLGEGRAFAELWSSYSTRVAAFVRSQGAVDVEEITNDVFLAVFTRLDSLEGGESGFVALLFTIARRRVVDELRRGSRTVPAVPWSAQDDVVGSSTQGVVQDAATTVELREEISDLLGVLTPDQREVVVLRLLADLSLEQVAAVLGCRIGTVKARQRRGLDALRRAVAARADSSGGCPRPHPLTDTLTDPLITSDIRQALP